MKTYEILTYKLITVTVWYKFMTVRGYSYYVAASKMFYIII